MQSTQFSFPVHAKQSVKTYFLQRDECGEVWMFGMFSLASANTLIANTTTRVYVCAAVVILASLTLVGWTNEAFNTWKWFSGKCQHESFHVLAHFLNRVIGRSTNEEFKDFIYDYLLKCLKCCISTCGSSDVIYCSIYANTVMFSLLVWMW